MCSLMRMKSLKFCCNFTNYITRLYATKSKEQNVTNQLENFETVFSFSFVKYIAVINRLKVYHIFGTSLAVPSCGLLELLNMASSYTFLTASYIGVTGAAVLSLASLPFRNTIGHLYISEDNSQIKISYLDFWGKRQDRIEPTENWIPLLDMKPRTMDALYLSPQLSDGTKFKLFIKFGKVLNSSKIGQVLE